MATLQEIETWWSIDDVQRLNLAFDALANAQAGLPARTPRKPRKPKKRGEP